MSPTVDSLLPLSFLEAVRNVDTPDDDPDTELVAELRNKRLGLSDTVYAQIRRYSDAVKRSQRTVRDEAVALARLIGRRPDAEAVFRAAGRYLANEAYQGISPMTRRDHAHAAVARRASDRAASREPHRRRDTSTAASSRVGSSVVLDVPVSVTHRFRAALDRVRVLRGRARRAASSADQRRRRGGPRAVHRARRRHVQLARRVAPAFLNSSPDILMLDERSLPRVQRALADAGLDGWLIYDFHGLNPVAPAMLGLDGMMTRRIFALIPATGAPTAITHAIEQGPWQHWPARVEQAGVQLVADARVAARRARRRQARRDGVFAGRRRAVPRSRACRRARDGARGGRDGRDVGGAGHGVLRDVDAR